MQKCYNYTRKKLKRKRENQGITLIALVITVIILLILAGTAITLSINGGNLFSKTNEAANEWNTAVAREESALSNVLEILDMAANPDLAKYKLTVKVNYDENGNETTVESPYYVWYPSAKYIDESSDENCKGIKCRVLYNDSTYGLQLISVEPITKVALGHKDTNTKITGEMGSEERAQNSYNRAIMTLNEKAEEYIETDDGSGIATDARCVGSAPLNKNYPDNLTGEARAAQMYTGTETYMNDYNGKYFNLDTNYETDYNRLKKIGATAFNDKTNGNYYWLASRNVYLNTASSLEHMAYAMKVVDSFGECTEDKFDYGALWALLGQYNAVGLPDKLEWGFRPVFSLSPEVKITGGAGTEESPFELGL